LNRASDITLGDLWGIDHIVPQLNDDKGTSLVMISSERGKLLFDKVLSDMIFQIVKIEDVVKYNPAIEANVHTAQNNIAFERDFGNKPIMVLLNQYCSKSVIKKLIKKIMTAMKCR
jgi:hypothetical protein